MWLTLKKPMSIVDDMDIFFPEILSLSLNLMPKSELKLFLNKLPLLQKINK